MVSYLFTHLVLKTSFGKFIIEKFALYLLKLMNRQMRTIPTKICTKELSFTKTISKVLHYHYTINKSQSNNRLCTIEISFLITWIII